MNPKSSVAGIPARVVVTGIGLVTPAGLNREASWLRICAGPATTAWLPQFDLPFPAAGAPLPMGWNAGEHDPIVALALRASGEAIAESGLDLSNSDLSRFGCVIGTSKGGLRSFATAMAMERSQAGASRGAANDFEARRLWQEFQPNAPAAAVSMKYGLLGPALCPVAACATGLVSVQRGVELIRQGYCDTVLAGSVDASLQPLVLASFKRLGVLAQRFDDPASACRPFDRRRSGFLIGEGGAIFVLERLDSALARGSKPYVEWLAGEVAADPTDMTRMEAQPLSLNRLIGEVVRQSGLSLAEIDYVNLHGTGTVPNDLCETRALRQTLGLAANHIACSSLKGTLGHLLGAAGSVELAATCLAIRDGIVPPTLNLEESDPECNLDYTPRAAIRRPLSTALKLSLGFGGHLAAAIVRKWEPI